MTFVNCTLKTPCPYCGGDRGYIGPSGNEWHSARVICGQCGRFHKWLSKSETARAKLIGKFNAELPRIEPDGDRRYQPKPPSAPTLSPEIVWAMGMLDIPPGQSLTLDLLKSQFRRLSKQHHPDLGGKAEDFRRLVEGRAILENFVLKNR